MNDDAIVNLASCQWLSMSNLLTVELMMLRFSVELEPDALSARRGTSLSQGSCDEAVKVPKVLLCLRHILSLSAVGFRPLCLRCLFVVQR